VDDLIIFISSVLMLTLCLYIFIQRMSIRSVQGETYCAKSGRKFTGQMKEKFIIVDCTKVLVGSYRYHLNIHVLKLMFQVVTAV